MNIVFLKSPEKFSLVFILNTLIGNETKHIVLLDVFLEKAIKFPVVLKTIDGEINDDSFSDLKPDMYVLNSTITSLNLIMRKIGESFNFNPHAKFIFLHEGNGTNYTKELSNYSILNANVLEITRQQCRLELRQITNCDHSIKYSVQDVTKITYNTQEYIKRRKHSGFTICFIDETVPPYSLYTICPNCSRNTGLGFETTDMALETLNITRNQLVVSGVDLSPESTKNWLTSGKCDMVLSPLSIIDDGLLDSLFPINDDELIWFVPSPSKVPKWKYIIKVFSLRIWMIWVITVSFSALVWFIGRMIDLNELRQHHRYIKPNFNIKNFIIFSLQKIFFFTQLFLEQGKVPSGEYLFQVAFMFVVVLPTIVFNMMYKTGFTSLLLGPDFFEDRIRSLEDIVDHELYVSFAEWRLSAFDGTSDKVKNYFKTHNTECETIPVCVKRMSTYKDLALLMSIENIRFDYEHFLDENGHSVITPIYPRFVKPLYGSILLKGNPFIEIMNQFTTRLRDYGFVAFILSKYNKKYSALEIEEDEQLSLEHLWGPFFILFCGISISVISFSVELVIFILKNRIEMEAVN